jgi:hypothetical protein
MIYDTKQYAESRLLNTVVLLKRKPVVVQSIYNNFTASVVSPIKSIVRPKEKIVSMDDLSILNLKLGFVNHKGYASYLTRRTLRHDWRQGLRVNNVSSTLARVNQDLIGRALLHRYPTFAEAVDLTKRMNCSSCAWCEDFALHGDNILWRYNRVGKLRDGVILLTGKYKFLQPQLMESIYDERYSVLLSA